MKLADKFNQLVDIVGNKDVALRYLGLSDRLFAGWLHGDEEEKHKHIDDLLTGLNLVLGISKDKKQFWNFINNVYVEFFLENEHVAETVKLSIIPYIVKYHDLPDFEENLQNAIEDYIEDDFKFKGNPVFEACMRSFMKRG